MWRCSASASPTPRSRCRELRRVAGHAGDRRRDPAPAASASSRRYSTGLTRLCAGSKRSWTRPSGEGFGPGARDECGALRGQPWDCAGAARCASDVEARKCARPARGAQLLEPVAIASRARARTPRACRPKPSSVTRRRTRPGRKPGIDQRDVAAHAVTDDVDGIARRELVQQRLEVARNSRETSSRRAPMRSGRSHASRERSAHGRSRVRRPGTGRSRRNP